MIWQRYFLKEFSKIFLLFLFCFYGLYMIIDYASHTSGLSQHHLQIRWQDLGLYYFYVLVSQAEILIPLALLIAFLKTLCTLNSRNELVALMAGGIKLKTLLRPFLLVAFFGTALLYLNEEFMLPKALRSLQHVEDTSKDVQSQKNLPASVKSVVLEDGTTILYHSYNSATEQFFDVYWIRSIDDIYRIKYLSPYTEIPRGHYVDHLLRQPSGQIARVEAFDSRDFPEMHFNSDSLHDAFASPEFFSLYELWQQMPSSSSAYSEKDSQILAAFYWKIGVPWLCLFAFLAPAPFCIQFSRQQPLFLIYVCSIFGLMAFYLVVGAAYILAKRQIVEPVIALAPLFGIVMAACFCHYTLRIRD